MNKLLTFQKIIIISVLTINNCFCWEKPIRDFYSNILWYSHKGLRTVHHVGDIIESDPKILNIIKKCQKSCFKMHEYIEKDATNKEIFLITSSIAAAALIATYINYKIANKIAVKMVGCDGSCKKHKTDESTNTEKHNGKFQLESNYEYTKI